MKIAYLISTHNRLTQAHLQMDLIKDFYSKFKNLANIDIYHAYNGPVINYRSYREKSRIIIQNRGFYDGAGDLIDKGIEQIINSGEDYKYIIGASSDVEFFDAKALDQIIERMEVERFNVAGSIWYFQPAFSTEFFVLKRSFTEKIWPIDLDSYRNTHKIESDLSNSAINLPILEWAFFNKIMKNTSFDKILLLPKRPVAHWLNHRFDPQANYFSPHNITDLQKAYELNGRKLTIDKL